MYCTGDLFGRGVVVDGQVEVDDAAAVGDGAAQRRNGVQRQRGHVRLGPVIARVHLLLVLDPPD